MRFLDRRVHGDGVVLREQFRSLVDVVIAGDRASGIVGA
jgi:hypothetical protein